MIGPLIVDGKEIWDSTKLSAYQDCEMLGKLKYEEHLVGKEPSEALAFGIGFHKAVEVWTHESLGGDVYDAAVGLATEAFVKVWEAELPQETREKLEAEGNRRSVANFVRLFNGFRTKFPLDMYEKVLAVEHPFTLALGATPKGHEVWWSGILDRVPQWQGEIYYADVKTSTYALDDNFFEKFRLSGQLMGYSWAGEQLGFGQVAGVLVQGVQVQAPLKTKIKLPEDLVQAEVIPFSPEQIEEWRQNTLLKIDRIHLARDEGRYVMNLGNACANFNGCSMRRICQVPASVRPSRKEQYFKERVWNPLARYHVINVDDSHGYFGDAASIKI